MGIQRLQPVSGGTDWSKYTPQSIISSFYIPSGLVNVWSTIINITGKGYLSHFIATTTSNANVEIKITIDDVLVQYTKSSPGANKPTGIGPTSLAVGSTSPGPNLLLKGLTPTITLDMFSALQYPTTNGTQGFVFIEQPIFFNKSIRIDLLSANSLTAYYSYLGGLSQ